MGFTDLFKKKEKQPPSKYEQHQQDMKKADKDKAKLDKNMRKIDRRIKELDRLEGDRKGTTFIGKVNKGMDRAGDAFDGFKKTSNEVVDGIGQSFGGFDMGGGSSSGKGRKGKSRDNDFGFGGFDLGPLEGYGAPKRNKGRSKKRSSNYWDMDIDNF